MTAHFKTNTWPLTLTQIHDRFIWCFSDYLYFKWCYAIVLISNDFLRLSLFQIMFCECLYFKWCFVNVFISSDVLWFFFISNDALWLPWFQMMLCACLDFKCFVIIYISNDMFCDFIYFKWCFVIVSISNDVFWFSWFQIMCCAYLDFKWCFVIVLISMTS
jgi:hypothetical protein